MIRRFGVAVFAVLALAGCSQAAALAPVGGNHLTTVRFAANDVLLREGVAVLTAPVCTTDGEAVNCQGSTVDNEPITVSSTAAAKSDVTVTVGSRVLYQGPIQDVLDAESRPTS